MIATNPRNHEGPDGARPRTTMAPALRPRMTGRGRTLTVHGRGVLLVALCLFLGYLVGLGHGARFFAWVRADASGWVTFQNGEVTP